MILTLNSLVLISEKNPLFEIENTKVSIYFFFKELAFFKGCKVYQFKNDNDKGPLSWSFSLMRTRLLDNAYLEKAENRPSSPTLYDHST